MYCDVNSNQGASLRVFVSRANCFRGLLLSMSTMYSIERAGDSDISSWGVAVNEVVL